MIPEDRFVAFKTAISKLLESNEPTLVEIELYGVSNGEIEAAFYKARKSLQIKRGTLHRRWVEAGIELVPGKMFPDDYVTSATHSAIRRMIARRQKLLDEVAQITQTLVKHNHP
jgi:hypothetical protein